MNDQRHPRGASGIVASLGRDRAMRWSDLCRDFGKSAVVTSTRRGVIARLLPGVYAIAGTETDFRVRAVALTQWALGVSQVTGLAAAHLWHIVDDPPQRVTIHVPVDWHLKAPPWGRLLRVSRPQRAFRMGRLAVVGAADAVVQSWREARPDVGAATVIAAVVREKCTAGELLEALEHRRQMPRRGQLAELIGLVGNTVTSYLEYVAWREVFPPRQFPQLRWQVEIWPRGRRRVMDAFDPEARIDLEFDGGSTHGGVDGFERDRERDADMRHASIEPLHFTYRDLTQRPDWCRSQYRALREQRLTHFGG